jgi:hypothetical protein
VLVSVTHPIDLAILRRALARSQKEVDLLERVGKALYGDRWQTQLAKALGMSDRTVRRWFLFESSIPWSFLADKLPTLFTAKSEELRKVLKELRGQTE